jgi:hypothetical protein
LPRRSDVVAERWEESELVFLVSRDHDVTCCSFGRAMVGTSNYF